MTQETFPEGGGSKAAEPMMGLAQPPKDVAQAVTEAADAQALELVTDAEALVITTPTEYEESASALQGIKGRLKSLEKARTDITDPMNTAKTRVMTLFAKPKATLERAEKAFKTAMLTFSNAERARARAIEAEAERVAEEERQRLLKRADKQEDQGHDIKAGTLRTASQQVAAPSAPPPTKAAGAHEVTTWKAKLTNKTALIKAVAMGEVSESYLLPDMRALTEVARLEKKQDIGVPGVEGVSETTISSRARAG